MKRSTNQRSSDEINAFLLRLSGKTTVMLELLSENQQLLKMIRDGCQFSEAVKFVNENW